MTYEDLLAGFRDYLQYERRYSSHTLEAYSGDIHQFYHFLQYQYDIKDVGTITHHHVRSWMVSLLKDKVQARSVRRKISSITHFYKWLRKTGKISHNPVLKIQLPKIPERLPSSIQANSLERLIQSLEDGPQEVPEIRDKVIISLLYGLGLRRSELIGLSWGDLDEGRRTLRIFGKGKKYRVIPVEGKLLKTLQEWRALAKETWNAEVSSKIILMDNGKPCYPKFVHNRVVELLSGVTTAERKSPHVLRHSMATHLMDSGAELNAVKGILGHASLAATQVYTHASISRIRDVYRQAHPKSGQQ